MAEEEGSQGDQDQYDEGLSQGLDRRMDDSVSPEDMPRKEDFEPVSRDELENLHKKVSEGSQEQDSRDVSQDTTSQNDQQAQYSYSSSAEGDPSAVPYPEEARQETLSGEGPERPERGDSMNTRDGAEIKSLLKELINIFKQASEEMKDDDVDQLKQAVQELKEQNESILAQLSAQPQDAALPEQEAGAGNTDYINPPEPMQDISQDPQGQQAEQYAPQQQEMPSPEPPQEESPPQEAPPQSQESPDPQNPEIPQPPGILPEQGQQPDAQDQQPSSQEQVSQGMPPLQQDNSQQGEMPPPPPHAGDGEQGGEQVQGTPDGQQMEQPPGIIPETGQGGQSMPPDQQPPMTPPPQMPGQPSDGQQPDGQQPDGQQPDGQQPQMPVGAANQDISNSPMPPPAANPQQDDPQDKKKKKGLFGLGK